MILMMSQQKTGTDACLEKAAHGVGNIVARCLLLCSRADLVFRLAIIVAYNSFIPITNKEVGGLMSYVHLHINNTGARKREDTLYLWYRQNSHALL